MIKKGGEKWHLCIKRAFQNIYNRCTWGGASPYNTFNVERPGVQLTGTSCTSRQIGLTISWFKW